MRLECADDTISTDFLGRFERSFNFCRMMSIVINNPYSVNESLGFETAMNTTERIQSFLDDREGNAAV